MTALEEPGRCPVCRARRREDAECFRCGADLSPLRVLEARAAGLRQQAREALTLGDGQAARLAARAAQLLCATAAGAALQEVCEQYLTYAAKSGGCP